MPAWLRPVVWPLLLVSGAVYFGKVHRVSDPAGMSQQLLKFESGGSSLLV